MESHLNVQRQDGIPHQDVFSWTEDVFHHKRDSKEDQALKWCCGISDIGPHGRTLLLCKRYSASEAVTAAGGKKKRDHQLNSTGGSWPKSGSWSCFGLGHAFMFIWPSEPSVPPWGPPDPQLSLIACYSPRHTVQTVTTAASPLLLCPAGEHITGPTAGHLSAERPIAEERAGSPWRRRHQGPDVSVAVVALSPPAPPLLAAPLPLPHHPHRVFHSAVD